MIYYAGGSLADALTDIGYTAIDSILVFGIAVLIWMLCRRIGGSIR